MTASKPVASNFVAVHKHVRTYGRGSAKQYECQTCHAVISER